MDLNLDTLKNEILEYLEGSDFAVFRSQPGALENLPMVMWDCDRYPDYQMFLDTARKIGSKLILFASRDFEESEIEEAIQQLEECEASNEERVTLERRLRSVRGYQGVTCSLELAFDHDARMFVYELHPDWYEDFLNVCDDIASRMPVGDEEDGSFDEYYGNNN